MKTIAVFFVLYFSATSLFAQVRNPQIRVCYQNNAYFWALEFEAPQNDQLGFCRYDNNLIGALSLVEYFYNKNKTQAVLAYFQTQNRTYSSCADANAKEYVGYEYGDGNNDAWQVCQFKDRSLIAKHTLINGWHDEANQRLTEALLKKSED